MAVELDIRKHHSGKAIIYNEWWFNFDNTAPRGFPERQQFMMQQGIDIRPILVTYMNKKPKKDNVFKLRFKNDGDATLFLLRWS
jgi:hypothetical protein